MSGRLRRPYQLATIHALFLCVPMVDDVSKRALAARGLRTCSPDRTFHRSPTASNRRCALPDCGRDECADRRMFRVDSHRGRAAGCGQVTSLAPRRRFQTRIVRVSCHAANAAARTTNTISTVLRSTGHLLRYSLGGSSLQYPRNCFVDLSFHQLLIVDGTVQTVLGPTAPDKLVCAPHRRDRARSCPRRVCTGSHSFAVPVTSGRPCRHRPAG